MTSSMIHVKDYTHICDGIVSLRSISPTSMIHIKGYTHKCDKIKSLCDTSYASSIHIFFFFWQALLPHTRAPRSHSRDLFIVRSHSLFAAHSRSRPTQIPSGKKELTLKTPNWYHQLSPLPHVMICFKSLML